VQPFEVAGVIVDFFAQGQTITGSYRDLKTWFGLSGADRFTVKVKEGYSVETVAQSLRDRFQKSRNISVQNTESFKKQIDDILNQSLALFDVLSSIGVVIGTLGVVNTLTMNVMERTREIGGLRSLGMTRGQVIRMILSEALGLGTMGMIYGLGFGFLFAQVIINALNRGNGYDLSFSFNLMPFVSGALLAIGISQLAALSPARRASRLNIVEAIKHE
jgi:putative ABC transport system permease protein